MRERPDFFLSCAGEFEPLSEPRGCWEKARLRDHLRDDHMLILIDPPLDGRDLDLGPTVISELVISSKYRGQTLYPISEWPSFVYVSRLLDDEPLTSLFIKPEQIELVAWGMIFPSLEQAQDQAKQFEK